MALKVDEIVMKKPVARLEESPFEAHEMFFSRTTKRGVISACNEVFARVSAYGVNELIGQPHNIIRHPDMPKAVFKYFWEVLKANKPIVAYVKNLASDGRYYWVLAAAFPTPDGYVSIRLKPTSELLPVVAELYRDILKVEKEEGVEKSYEILFEKLKALGYRSYNDFARHSLIREIESREKIIASRNESNPHSQQSHGSHFSSENQEFGRLISQLRRVSAVSVQKYKDVFTAVSDIADVRNQLHDEAKTIENSYRQIQYLSLNMSAEAARAGEHGRTLSVISEVFSQWGLEVRQSLASFVATVQAVSERLDHSSFSIVASRCQIEMIDYFSSEMHERASNGGLTGADIESLKQDMHVFLSLSRDAIALTQDDVSDLVRAVKSVKPELSRLNEALGALSIVRQNGRIESARFAALGVSFQEHISDMAAFLEELGRGVKKISDLTALLESRIASIDSSTLHTLRELRSVSLAPSTRRAA